MLGMQDDMMRRNALKSAMGLLVLVLSASALAATPVPSRHPAPPESPIVLAGAGKWPVSAQCAPPGDATARRAEVLSLVNRHRKAHGLGALSANPQLTEAAQRHACDNAYQGGYSHYGSDGSDLKKRLKRTGYRYRTAAENTGWGFGKDSARMVDYWMNSTYHRANILNPKIRHFGLGVARLNGGRTAWVMNVGKGR